MDKIIDAGVTVFKIEGRARSGEYVKRAASAYRTAADAVCDGTYTPELAASLKEGLSEVFNRGFWDGYYQGARLGEWCDVYGSKATKRKVYVGKITNYFAKIGVAEIYIESGELSVGPDTDNGTVYRGRGTHRSRNPGGPGTCRELRERNVLFHPSRGGSRRRRFQSPPRRQGISF